MFESLLLGFQNVLNFSNIFLMLFGCFLGLIFGAIPGLSPTIAIALFLPITFGMAVTPAFSVLMALYIGGVSGGLVSAILINIPGTASSVGTCFDGSPMARKGQGGKALGVGTFYSFIGTILSIIVLVVLAPQLVRIAVTFGPYEFFALSFFSLMLVAGLCGESMAKGIVSASLGLLISLTGMGIIDGVNRFTFGSIQMLGGFNSVPVLIGLFAIPEILKTAGIRSRIKPPDYKSTKIVGFGFSLNDFRASFGNMMRSAAIGIGIGILPGIGGGTSNILAYAAAKSASKHPELFGTGVMDGVVATETANNASIGGAMVPLLTLGIPGDVATAMLLGAFMLHGFQPGPIFFMENLDLVYSIFAAMIICAFATVIIEYFGMRIFTKILGISPNALLPFVLMFCVVGSFAVNNRVFDVLCLLPFGILSFVLEKYGFPLPPIILGFILGPICEQNLARGLQRSQGSIVPFFTRPISCIFIVLGIIYVVWIVYKQLRPRQKNKPQIA
jgi:putative tricarboxylic transport membrane protein